MHRLVLQTHELAEAVEWSMIAHSIANGLEPSWSEKRDGLPAMHYRLRGFIGERAAYKWMGLPWDVEKMTKQYLEHNHELRLIKDTEAYEIRTTISPTEGLSITRRSNDCRKYLLVDLHALPVVEIVGWAWGRDGKKDEYKRRDFWRMPRSELNPVIERFYE